MQSFQRLEKILLWLSSVGFDIAWMQVCFWHKESRVLFAHFSFLDASRQNLRFAVLSQVLGREVVRAKTLPATSGMQT